MAEEVCVKDIEDEVHEEFQRVEGILTGTSEAVLVLVRPEKVETGGLVEEFTKGEVVG